MGFKEVMNLRQEGESEKALKLAREDYEIKQDQWSASALFWVLKDIATTCIEEGNSEDATSLVTEMEGLVDEMGATINVATETVEKLQKQVIPHFVEMEELQAELRRSKLFLVIEEGYLKARGWMEESDNPHPALHEPYAEIMYIYLKRKADELSSEEFQEYIASYLALENPRPSKLHSQYLKLLLKAKLRYESDFDLNPIVSEWDLTNLRPEDWKQRRSQQGAHVSQPLAMRVLSQSVAEFYTQKMDGGQVALSAPLYQLLMDAESLLPDDELVQLTRARVEVIDDRLEEARKLYEELLVATDLGEPWYEFALLCDEHEVDIKAGALSKALQIEDNTYLDYVAAARLELADCLVRQEIYSSALRELEMYAQICLEKGRETKPKYTQLMSDIPEETTSNRDNKEFYFQHSRVAEEYIYADIEEETMIVIDVIAMRLQEPQKQIVPMLKLMNAEGKTALVSPRISGVLDGDNRGRLYEVKLLPRQHAYTKVLLLTPSEKDAKEMFPTVVARINGYSEAVRAHHLIDTTSHHHYLPGEESMWDFGDFVNFLLVREQFKPRNNRSRQGGSYREYLLLPEPMVPEEAIPLYPAQTCIITSISDDEVEVMTEEGYYGTASPEIASISLLEGDRVMCRGFVQRHKNRRTGDFTYSFTPLSIEEFNEEM
ncbi:MAG: hypothetical protein Q4D93_02140 [Porphyromonas sp.]|nr:hypothetical protein [Porphyromonas sp.]